MGEIRTEPSMEEILASIKRIIADDSLALNARSRARAESAPVADAAPDPVLELTQPVAAPEPAAPPPPPVITPPTPESATPESALPESAPADPTPPPIAAQAPPPLDPPPPAAPLVSDDAAGASRQALSNLSSMMLHAPGAENTLDGLVREMLRPMLKEWLDQRLPDLVEALVAREIARITGKDL